MTITTHDGSPETFQEVRRKSASYSEALNRYARSLEGYYSCERAKAESPGEISVAEWITYRSEGVSFSGLNLVLLLLGVYSFNEKIGLHPYRTFHPCSPKGQLSRNLLAGLAEAAGLLLGLTGICLIIFGVAFFLFPNEHPLRNKITSIVLGFIVLIGSRLILRFSKVLKIPSKIWKDPTSPFRLHSLKKLT
jgi:hypothetical protein